MCKSLEYLLEIDWLLQLFFRNDRMDLWFFSGVLSIFLSFVREYDLWLSPEDFMLFLSSFYESCCFLGPATFEDCLNWIIDLLPFACSRLPGFSGITSTFFAVDGFVDMASLTLSEQGDAELLATYLTSLAFDESRLIGFSSLAADLACFFYTLSVFAWAFSSAFSSRFFWGSDFLPLTRIVFCSSKFFFEIFLVVASSTFVALVS